MRRVLDSQTFADLAHLPLDGRVAQRQGRRDIALFRASRDQLQDVELPREGVQAPDSLRRSASCWTSPPIKDGSTDV